MLGRGGGKILGHIKSLRGFHGNCVIPPSPLEKLERIKGGGRDLPCLPLIPLSSPSSVYKAKDDIPRETSINPAFKL